MIKQNEDYLNKLLALEGKQECPLSQDDPEFQALGTIWLTGTGVHLVFDKDTKKFVFGCKIE